jgi:hypothetical protein
VIVGPLREERMPGLLVKVTLGVVADSREATGVPLLASGLA